MSATTTATPTPFLTNPARTHRSPKALAADASLPRARRVALLQRWKRDLQARDAAIAEGMPAPTTGKAYSQRPDVRDVALALESIRDAERPTTTGEGRLDVEPAHIPLTSTAGTKPVTTDRTDEERDDAPHLSRGEVVFWSTAIVATGLMGAPLLASAAGALLLFALILTRLPFFDP